MSNGSDWFYQLSRTAQKLKKVLRRTDQISGIFLALTNQFSGIFSTLPPKIIKNKDQKHFDQQKFLHDLDSKLLQRDLYRNCNDPYEKLSEIFVNILNHHAPVKEKQIRGYRAPFILKN